MPDKLVEHKKIEGWATLAFMKIGVPAKDAETIAKALTKTSLWGIDSHGIARVTHYLKRFENGTIKTTPQLLFNKTGYAAGQLDGGDGHGIVILTEATRYAIGLAKDAGAGVIGVQDSSHCGAIGLYTRQITEAGMVGIAFTHSDALVIPHLGKKAFFGTNPISIAFPTENNEEPICVDMATSMAPWNIVMNARLEKKSIPAGVGVDANGNDATNADEIAALKPLGGHKGYALAFIIDMLCGPLNGMPYGPNITSMYKDMDKKRSLGSLVIAIDPERFGGAHTIRQTGTAIINHLKTQGNEVLFPGQPEYIKRTDRLKNGIPLSQVLQDDFNQWSSKLGIPALS